MLKNRRQGTRYGTGDNQEKSEKDFSLKKCAVPRKKGLLVSEDRSVIISRHDGFSVCRGSHMP